jgi:hypothetical protein
MKRIGQTAATLALAAGLAGAATLGSGFALAQDTVQAGVSAAVRGDVQVARADVVGRQVESGESIFLQDAIESGADSGMQILLLDESVFTIGPESALTIDEYVYDPATGDGSLAADMTKGVMRFVSGNIAAGTPENMTIKLPAGTIGIRGTIGLIAVLDEETAAERFPDQFQQLGGGGQAAGQPVVFAALVGPGPFSTTGDNTGSFTFSSPNGSVDLNRPGGSVLATPGQPPVFFLSPPGALQDITRPLNQAPDDTGDADEAGDTETGDQAGGQPTGAGGGLNSGGDAQNAETEAGVGGDQGFSSALDVENTSNTAADNSSVADAVASSGAVGTTFGQIVDANTGTLTGSTSLTGSVTGDLSVDIDTSARWITISFSNLNDGGSLSNDSLGISGYALNDGANGLRFGLGTSVPASSGCSAFCTGQVTFTGTNSLSGRLEHDGNVGTGSMTLSSGL